jgi:hypothetical protein
MDLAKTLDEDFPDADYYRHIIDLGDVLQDSALLKDIGRIGSKDELARHLLCSPTLFVLHRRLTPDKGALYVRFFGGSIVLAKWEAQTYKDWYPTKKFLLYAPGRPEHIWLADYLNGKRPQAKRFSISA